eukprot:TRINITY_DN2984_c0_g1_i3.p1 TRINITY_DN2984_c0_g1~~TRINITY_DN2984_c0_g1_i3.p1  ORF type:complete len:317 (+),score=92.45 TRINITY_DN2984_c0_g1_i3:76-1026(+)
MLRGVQKISTETSLLGRTIRTPICVAPSAMQRMAHPDGEAANMRAASTDAGAFILSSLSTTSLEDVAQAGPNTYKFYQLYVYKDREVTLNLVQRAEAAGYNAIVLTVDTPYLGRRDSDVRLKFKLPPQYRLANFDNALLAKRVQVSQGGSGLQEYVASLLDANLTWESVRWLKSVTKLPVFVKGVMTAEDTTLAIEFGADAIIVSNHGARQLDTVPATIEVLPEVVAAAAGRVEVYLDGGVRSGTDVFKALALGARAVFLGRPILYGLAAGGEAGVRRMLQILNDELKLAMALAGCKQISDINRQHVVHVSHFSKL